MSKVWIHPEEAKLLAIEANRYENMVGDIYYLAGICRICKKPHDDGCNCEIDKTPIANSDIEDLLDLDETDV